MNVRSEIESVGASLTLSSHATRVVTTEVLPLPAAKGKSRGRGGEGERGGGERGGGERGEEVYNRGAWSGCERMQPSKTQRVEQAIARLYGTEGRGGRRSRGRGIEREGGVVDTNK